MGKPVHRMLEVNLDTNRGVCAHCGVVRLKRKKRPNGRVQYACSKGAKRWDNDRSAWWKLTADERAELERKQKGVCGICGEDRKLVVDHNHATGAVRGLLCIPCNTALGRFERDGWPKAANLYLKGKR